MSSPKLPGSTYSDQTKKRIVNFVRQNPGLKGREIAERLGLEKSRVNSFLYGEGKKDHGLIDEEWCWRYYPISRNEEQKAAEQEAKRRVEQEAKRRVEQEAKRRVEQEAKRRVEQEAKRRVEQEAKRKAKPAYHPDLAPSPAYRPDPIPTKIPQTSICGNLSAMGRTNATIKIRGMSLELIELAFQEDDYMQLDDLCKAELAARRSILLQKSPVKEGRPFNFLPILLSVIVFAFVFSMFAARNEQRNTPAPTSLPAHVNR